MVSCSAVGEVEAVEESEAGGGGSQFKGQGSGLAFRPAAA